MCCAKPSSPPSFGTLVSGTSCGHPRSPPSPISGSFQERVLDYTMKAPSLGASNQAAARAHERGALARAAQANTKEISLPSDANQTPELAQLIAHIQALRWELSTAEKELTQVRAEASGVNEEIDRLASRKDVNGDAEAALMHDEDEYSRMVAMYSGEIHDLQEELATAAEARKDLEARLGRLSQMVIETREARDREEQERATMAAALAAAPGPPSPLRNPPSPVSPLRSRMPPPSDPFCRAAASGSSTSSSSLMPASSTTAPDTGCSDDAGEFSKPLRVSTTHAASFRERALQARGLRPQVAAVAAATALANSALDSPLLTASMGAGDRIGVVAATSSPAGDKRSTTPHGGSPTPPLPLGEAARMRASAARQCGCASPDLHTMNSPFSSSAAASGSFTGTDALDTRRSCVVSSSATPPSAAAGSCAAPSTAYSARLTPPQRSCSAGCRSLVEATSCAVNGRCSPKTPVGTGVRSAVTLPTAVDIARGATAVAARRGSPSPQPLGSHVVQCVSRPMPQPLLPVRDGAQQPWPTVATRTSGGYCYTPPAPVVLAPPHTLLMSGVPGSATPPQPCLPYKPPWSWPQWPQQVTMVQSQPQSHAPQPRCLQMSASGDGRGRLNSGAGLLPTELSLA